MCLRLQAIGDHVWITLDSVTNFLASYIDNTNQGARKAVSRGAARFSRSSGRPVPGMPAPLFARLPSTVQALKDANDCVLMRAVQIRYPAILPQSGVYLSSWYLSSWQFFSWLEGGEWRYRRGYKADL